MFLKRRIKERWINNYNPEMLHAWNANMDIQLAIDTYAIITYIVSYMNKAETQMTKFHPPSREHFSLKIVVRDQIMWNCILEL